MCSHAVDHYVLTTIGVVYCILRSVGSYHGLILKSCGDYLERTGFFSVEKSQHRLRFEKNMEGLFERDVSHGHGCLDTDIHGLITLQTFQLR